MKPVLFSLLLLSLLSCRKDKSCEDLDILGEYVGETRYRYYPQSSIPSEDSTYSNTKMVSCSGHVISVDSYEFDLVELVNNEYFYSNSIDGNGGQSWSYRFVGDSLYSYYSDWWWGYDHVYSFAGKKLP